MTPICVMPHSLEQFATTNYRKYGYKILPFESKMVENIESNLQDFQHSKIIESKMATNLQDSKNSKNKIDSKNFKIKIDSKNSSFIESNLDSIKNKNLQNIESNTLKISKNHNLDSKNILLFIGGFLDSYYRCLFDVFMGSLNSEVFVNGSKIDKIQKMYITFDCYKFLSFFIPKAINNGYRFYIIAHSWGAKNILRVLLKYDFSIELLLTLDCVGHFKITHRPRHIKMWENIYIEDFTSHYNRANLAALIGGGKQEISFADINTGLQPPAHHASVNEMLKVSKCIQINNLLH